MEKTIKGVGIDLGGGRKVVVARHDGSTEVDGGSGLILEFSRPQRVGQPTDPRYSDGVVFHKGGLTYTQVALSDATAEALALVLGRVLVGAEGELPEDPAEDIE